MGNEAGGGAGMPVRQVRLGQSLTARLPSCSLYSSCHARRALCCACKALRRPACIGARGGEEFSFEWEMRPREGPKCPHGRCTWGSPLRRASVLAHNVHLVMLVVPCVVHVKPLPHRACASASGEDSWRFHGLLSVFLFCGPYSRTRVLQFPGRIFWLQSSLDPVERSVEDHLHGGMENLHFYSNAVYAMHLGAILWQFDKEKRKNLVYYASRQMSMAEQNYTTMEREALVVVYSCKKL